MKVKPSRAPIPPSGCLTSGSWSHCLGGRRIPHFSCQRRPQSRCPVAGSIRVFPFLATHRNENSAMPNGESTGLVGWTRQRISRKPNSARRRRFDFSPGEADLMSLAPKAVVVLRKRLGSLRTYDDPQQSVSRPVALSGVGSGGHGRTNSPGANLHMHRMPAGRGPRMARVHRTIDTRIFNPTKPPVRREPAEDREGILPWPTELFPNRAPNGAPRRKHTRRSRGGGGARVCHWHWKSSAPTGLQPSPHLPVCRQ